ncbi:hypothetical protein JTB14_038204 [Gonioctena quinquepunctata]|nr:hypothetical protein JTB14_038204 [Gonioctena quinquepunctata]
MLKRLLLLYFFDRLFDSVNGSNKLPDRGKCLRTGLTDTSDHLDFWNGEALPILDTMQFQKRSPRDQARPPSLKNWPFTIENIKSILGVLKSKGLSYLLTRRLNQDPLVNAYGQLRSFGAQNINPSSHQFVGNFKMLLFNTALSFYKNYSNCEDISDNILFQ